MRKSGWAAATGLASLVLLLAACGSSGTTPAAGGGPASGAPSSQASGGSPGSSGQAATSPASSASSSKGTGGSNPTSGASPHHSVGPQPSSGTVTFPPQGTTFMIVLHTKLGYVLGQAHGSLVVYTYAKDKKGGAPTCVGACASQWPPVTGMPKAGPADRFPGTFGVVKGSGGVEQITYNGMPLYRYAGAKAFTTPGQGVGGVWHVVPLSASDIMGA
jgi:predicted lipoprotein with Yx(FWY)xxD motif